MGNCNFKSSKDKETTAVITKQQFALQYAIGRGGFGKVWRVQSKKDKREEYAMKEMAKARIITKKSVQSVMSELSQLAMIRSDFIVNVHFAFQDRTTLYLVMDLLLGGDLRYHIARKRKFSEECTRFFIACLVHALDAVHSCNIIHRDIKPENLVFDNEGYLRLTDFGVAKTVTPENANETSGTPGYMAPEVMCRQNHGLVSDYFAVGVIAFECMMSRRPYVGKSRREIREHILTRQVQIKKNEVPAGWSLEAADFINKTIQRKPQNRLGHDGGVKELKNHVWFKKFDWDMLASRQYQSPFVPDITSDNFDQNHVNNQEWKDAEAVKEAETTLRRDSVQKLFEIYYFNKKEMRIPPPQPNPMGLSSKMATTGVPTTNGNEDQPKEILLSSSKKTDTERQVSHKTKSHKQGPPIENKQLQDRPEMEEVSDNASENVRQSV